MAGALRLRSSLSLLRRTFSKCTLWLYFYFDLSLKKRIELYTVSRGGSSLGVGILWVALPHPSEVLYAVLLKLVSDFLCENLSKFS